MTYTFNTNTEKADRNSILEQCSELYTHKDFDFIVGGGSINGIKALCPAVQLFCICNGMAN
tara:strand:- start:331 stop:513 length:183 start_codon:yes stop_codon:yes gene_type:complete